MKLPTLPADVSRCHDVTCPKREKCLRFRRRSDEGWRIVSAATFRGDDGECVSFISIDPNDWVRKH